MNSQAKTADRSAAKSGSASCRLTNDERDWMLSLTDSELRRLLQQMPPASRKIILSELRDHPTPRERTQQQAEASLHEFVRQAWPVVESQVDFVDNWHIAALCQHLEAVTGQLFTNGCPTATDPLPDADPLTPSPSPTRGIGLYTSRIFR